MRVAVYYRNDDVRVEERPKPEVGPGEALVRVDASGICGSDVMEWYRARKAPLVLGHEIAGEVAAVGAGVTRFAVGERVVVAHHVPCNTCRYCHAGHHSVCDTLRSTGVDPGGFAEFIRVPALNVDRGMFRIPDRLSTLDASLTEPLACAVRAQRLADLHAGQSVLVVGSGMAGALHILLARALGAGRILAADIVPSRLALATRLGADAAIDSRADLPAKVREANDGRGADLVIIATAAAPAIAAGLRSVDRGGTVLFFAPTEPGREVPIPLFEMWHDEVRLVSSYAGPPREMRTALELLGGGRIAVGPLVTHRVPMAEVGRGFQLVATAQDSLKVVLEPQR